MITKSDVAHVQSIEKLHNRSIQKMTNHREPHDCGRVRFKIHTWHHSLHATWSQKVEMNCISSTDQNFQVGPPVGTPEITFFYLLW